MNFLRQLYWELFRMFARKRTYIGFGIFVALEVLIVFMTSLDGPRKGMEKYIERAAGGIEEYFSALTLAVMVVPITVLLLSSLFLALVAGDIVAKETEDGNLRLLLARPVSRLRILLLKFLACQIYATTLFLFIGTTVLLMGLYMRGWGGKMVVVPFFEQIDTLAIFDWDEGLGRYFLGLLFLSVSFLPVTGFAFFLSCWKIKPVAATIVTAAVLMADFILRRFPFFEDYQHWFVTPRMDKWVFAWNQDIPWPKVVESWTSLVGISVTCFVLGWVAFQRRDVKS
jgi:ABC-2 type transport system permease protein